MIIEPDYGKMSKWAANYVAKCINEANPTAEKPFKLGCPTGSSPLGMYKELIALNPKRQCQGFEGRVRELRESYLGSRWY